MVVDYDRRAPRAGKHFLSLLVHSRRRLRRLPRSRSLLSPLRTLASALVGERGRKKRRRRERVFFRKERETSRGMKRCSLAFFIQPNIRIESVPLSLSLSFLEERTRSCSSRLCRERVSLSACSSEKAEKRETGSAQRRTRKANLSASEQTLVFVGEQKEEKKERSRKP